MKIIITLILNLFFLVNVAFSQKNTFLPLLSKDTLAIASELSCWLQNLKNAELLNTTHSEIIDKTMGTYDSSFYLYSGNREFSADGCNMSVFVLQSTINNTPDCSWIEIKEIKLKKHRILLMLILHKKASSVTAPPILYTFKITYHHEFGPQYKLIKKHPLKQ